MGAQQAGKRAARDRPGPAKFGPAFAVRIPSADADDEHTFAVLGQTVFGSVQNTMAHLINASPDGPQPFQNHTQCLRVARQQAFDILEQKRPRLLGGNGLHDATN